MKPNIKDDVEATLKLNTFLKWCSSEHKDEHKHHKHDVHHKEKSSSLI